MTQAILQRIAKGDKSAVQDCLDAYGGLVWSIARKMLRNSDEAEDVVQEIFTDIWKNAARFDESKSSETTYAYADDTPGGTNAGSAYVFTRTGTA